MPCERVQTQLADYSEGRLYWWHARSVKAHLSQCPHCQRAWQRLQQVPLLLQDLPEYEPPSDVMWSAVQQRLRQREMQQAHPWSQVRVPPRLAYAGVLMALATAGAAMLHSYFSQPSTPLVAGNPRPPALTYVRQHTEMAGEEPFADRVVIGALTSASRH